MHVGQWLAKGGPHVAATYHMTQVTVPEKVRYPSEVLLKPALKEKECLVAPFLQGVAE
jgi:hypothetical protein